MRGRSSKISISAAQDGFEEKYNASRDPEKNPFKQRDLQHPTSDNDTLIHLAKGSFGTGVFAMPFAFANAGYVTGLIGSIIIGFICSHCVHILVKSAQELCWRHNIPTLNFGTIAEVAFREGPKKTRKLAVFMKILIQSFILVIALGACCIFKVFVAANLYQVIEYHTDARIDMRLYILMVGGFAIMLTMIRNLRFLAPVSLLSNALVMASVVIVFIYIFDDLPSITTREPFMPLSKLPIFFSIIVYSLEGINVVMPLENNMKNPQNFLGCFNVLNTAMTMIVSLFTLVGFLGFLKYGPEVEGSISLSLPPDEWLAQASKIMLSIAILLSHPLQFYCAIEFTWPKLAPKIGRKFPRFSGMLGEYIYRITLILITIAVAVSVPNLGALISIGGAVCLSTLGLMFPSLIETMVFWDNLGKWKWILWKNILIFLFGVAIFVFGLIGSILDLILSFQDDDSPEEEGFVNSVKQLAEKYYFI